MKKVNVLLSSYNGEKYIKVLLDSILSQKDVNVDLLVRDDGSTDKTKEILNSYKTNKKLDWYCGSNIKPARSFMQLLKDSHDTDYYAFADEDDYWKEDKLSVAIKAIEAYEDSPALYFSRTQLTDENLNPIEGPIINPLLSFGESLVYEFIPGCTMVFNKKMRDIINIYTPAYIPMHDVWIYCIAQAVGAKIYFDKNSHILYRQHGNNTIGQGQGEMHEWKRRLNRLVNKEHSRSRRAKELYQGYHKFMDKTNLDILETFIGGTDSLAKRLKLINDKRFTCANEHTNQLFKLALLMNIY